MAKTFPILLTHQTTHQTTHQKSSEDTIKEKNAQKKERKINKNENMHLNISYSNCWKQNDRSTLEAAKGEILDKVCLCLFSMIGR